MTTHFVAMVFFIDSKNQPVYTLSTKMKAHQNSITIQCLEDFGQLESHASRWNQMLSRAPTNTVFQTWEWHQSWWNAFGIHHRLQCYLAFQGDELVGIAPLMISKQSLLGLNRRVLRFVGDGASDYVDFLIDKNAPQSLQALLNRIMQDQKNWDMLDWKNLPETSKILIRLNSISPSAKRKAWVESLVCTEAPSRLLGNSDSDQKLLRKQSLKRHLNFFQKQGELTFETVSDPDAIQSHLNSFYDQHIQRWKLHQIASQFLHQAQRQFFRELAQNSALVRFSILKFEGEPLAYHFGFEFEGRFIWYKPTFNTKYQKNGPGEVLIRFLMQEAMSRGLREFDFTVGTEAFKYRFANITRPIYQIRAYRNDFFNRFYLFARGLKRMIRRRRLAMEEQEALRVASI